MASFDCSMTITHYICILLTLFGMLMLSFSIEPYGDGFLLQDCLGIAADKANSTHEANVKTFLSSLASNASQDGGFYTTVVGWGTTNPISGQLLCRGDVTPTTCQHCVTRAAEVTLSLCPNGTQSIIYYDLCMLRYTSKSFKFDSLYDAGVMYGGKVKTEISDQRHFNQSVWRLLREVAAKAANSGLPDKKFATAEAQLTATQKLYGLGQCTPDLTTWECTQCFETAFQRFERLCEGDTCPEGSPSARVILGGCYVRYEMHPFYNVSKALPAPTPSHVPSAPSVLVPTAPSSGNKHESNLWISMLSNEMEGPFRER